MVKTDDLREVRVPCGGDVLPVAGFFEQGTLLILAHGFARKTQKTPAQDSALAAQRKIEYLARKKQFSPKHL